MNQNPVTDIRACERVKYDQALYILTMYQKKVRTPLSDDPNTSIDAQKEHQESIIHYWNRKWKTDLTKPIINGVTSIYPRVFYDLPDKEIANEQAMQYNQVMEKFIKRLRVDHEDQTNFKLVERRLQIDCPENKRSTAFESAFHFLEAIRNILNSMMNSIAANADRLHNIETEDNYSDETMQLLQSQLEIVERLSVKIRQSKQNLSFIATTVEILEHIKESEYGSTLIAAQPDLEQLTEVIHPLFMPIYAHWLNEKEHLRRKNQNKDRKTGSESELNDCQKPFPKFFGSSSSSLSKVVLLNLDGYESQFNLQFARCFKKNLMYISFPKQCLHSEHSGQDNVCRRRFYKKLMYNYEKNDIQSSNTGEQMMNETDELYRLLKNPEDYHIHVQNELYRLDRGNEDLNKNMYIFPSDSSILQENLGSFPGEAEHQKIDVSESQAVLQIFKLFLINQIRKFNATHIIVSYSGRLILEDKHYVEVMQQLTKLSHYKVILFPNLTVGLCNRPELNTQNISYLSRPVGPETEMTQDDGKPEISYDFFNKIVRFLKVCSGTHSLVKPFEDEGVLSKYKNFNVVKAVNRLMELLGYEYENIERIRFKNKQIDLLPKLYQEDANKVIRVFNRLVPQYYFDLYEVLAAMIAQQEGQSNPSSLQILTQFNINELTAHNHYQVQELIRHFKGRVVIRGALGDHQHKNLTYTTLLKQLHAEREKHFLEVSQEKYEDSKLFYFRTRQSKILFEESHEEKPNLRGLIEMSFMNPNQHSKEILPIFEATQVLYTVQQIDTTGSVPILFMSHLPLSPKFTPKFDNYCALVDRNVLSKIDQIQNYKIPQERKIKRVYPIRFFDRNNQEIVENRFEIRTRWNFTETQEYMILYWPCLYNMINAVCAKVQGKVYRPPLLNEFFSSDKKVVDGCIHFYQTQVPDDISPRNGCSAYCIRNQMYILGGFYDQSKNYLELQRDVTRVNFDYYDHQNQRKLQIVNEKEQLYPAVGEQRPDHRLNSYVRARSEYEFYDMEELVDEEEMDNGIRTVVMLGGYGQNYLHPYSMLVYYYSILKFRSENGRLLSIEKKLVYNKSVPINMSYCSKNMGVIKTNIRQQASVTAKPMLTEPDSYGRFRVVYKLINNELDFKFQFMFSEKDCKLMKEQLRKLDNDSIEIAADIQTRMIKITGYNNQIVIQQEGSRIVVNLQLEPPQGFKYEEELITLTNESVSYLSIVNEVYLIAIVKNPFIVKGSSIVAEYRSCDFERPKQSQQSVFIPIKPMPHPQLVGDLSLHVIQASNVNLVYVLHGHRIFESDQIHEYQIMHNRRDGSKDITEIRPKPPAFPVDNKPRCCYSTFFNSKTGTRSQIVCESYITLQESNVVYRVCEKFDPANSQVLQWVQTEKPVPYLICLRGPNNAINLDRIAFTRFYRSENQRLFIVCYNKKQYKIVITGSEARSETGQHLLLMEPISEEHIKLIEDSEADEGKILTKKPSSYIDRGYITDD